MFICIVLVVVRRVEIVCWVLHCLDALVANNFKCFKWLNLQMTWNCRCWFTYLLCAYDFIDVKWFVCFIAQCSRFHSLKETIKLLLFRWEWWWLFDMFYWCLGQVFIVRNKTASHMFRHFSFIVVNLMLYYFIFVFMQRRLSESGSHRMDRSRRSGVRWWGGRRRWRCLINTVVWWKVFVGVYPHWEMGRRHENICLVMAYFVHRMFLFLS